MYKFRVMNHRAKKLALISISLLASVSLVACARSPAPQIESRLGGDQHFTYKGGRSAVGPFSGKPMDGVALKSFQTSVGDIVYFSSDSADITSDAQHTLAKQAQWLKNYPGQTVSIEGHADERGTREYNIALGARRAASVKAFLIAQGVASSRMRTISYGKERPVAICDDISCWSKNRRAETSLGANAVSRN